MIRYGSVLAVVFCCLLVTRASQQTAIPTFANRTDLLVLDVSLIDKSRRPVPGLGIGDFSVTIDGKPAPILAFNAISVSRPEPLPLGPAAWLRDVPADVSTNAKPSARVVAILIDDFGLTGTGQLVIRLAKQTAIDVLEHLGPDDQAAVLFTDNVHTAETFTTDHARLKKAVDDAVIYPAGENPTVLAGCQCEVCPISALDQLAVALQSLPEQRKVVFYISPGSVTPIQRMERNLPTNNEQACLRQRRDAMYDALRHAQFANLTIESFDPTGIQLRRIDRSGRADPFGPLEDPSKQRIEFLRTISETTGGRAVVNNNDPNLQVPAVLTESSAYYLLGVQPAPPKSDGTLHSVKVRVSRRDVEVQTRNGYYDKTEADRSHGTATPATDLQHATSGSMPATGFPLELTTAAFAMPDRHPVSTMALGVWPPSDLPPGQGPQTEQVDVTATLLSPESNGDVQASYARHVGVTWQPDDGLFGHYEILGTVPIPAGVYELRVGVKADGGRTASVYSRVEVPTFNGEISASDLVLEAEPTPVIAALDKISDIVPVTPTVRRSFRRQDKAVAFLRIYQSARRGLPVTVTATITDTNNRVIADDMQRPQGGSDDTRPVIDYLFPLPLATLSRGDYLLTIKAVAGSKDLQRRIRFHIQ